MNCDLCLSDTRPKCDGCGKRDEGPIVQRITIWKSKRAYRRKENIDVCKDCERTIWRAIQECKGRAS